MRRILPIALVVLCLPVLVAADWTKAYFAATTPGTWAKHRLTSSLTNRPRRRTRGMPDENGQVVIDQFAEFSDSSERRHRRCATASRRASLPIAS